MAAPMALAGCGRALSPPPAPGTLADLTWPEIEAVARGSAVRFAMWSGDEARNRFFRETVRATLAREFSIQLELVPTADVADIVNQLLNEKSAGKAGQGSVDLVWINGENFRTTRQAGLLWGPFAHLLPNRQLYDEALCARDFGTPVDGMEAPWLKAQFVMAHDTARTPTPPAGFPELRAWMESHPGRFAYIAPPDFTGSVFLRHLLLDFGNYAPGFTQGFSEALYQEASLATFAWLRAVKPLLWRKGDTYPASPQELNRLFANREVDFTMNYSPMFASRAIERGEFPDTVRTFVFDSGTIGNYSFLAIPFNANNPAAAVVVANHLMAPEHLLPAMRVLGGPYPHRLDALTPAQRESVAALPRGVATLPDTILASRFLPEPDAAYLSRLEKDWRAEVLLR
ncbi:MAG: ABC transporter substrate-binding protein [Bryobacterales bacterium]|nr:ABC transporter substrate-binding protein [Bryobacterales bacterium]